MKKNYLFVLVAIILICFMSCKTVEPVNYGISYNLDGGTFEEGKDNPASYSEKTPTFTLNAPLKKGYTFEGWIVNGDKDNLKTEVTIEEGSVGDMNLTATWKIVVYTITYGKNILVPEVEVPIVIEEPTNKLSYTVEDDFTLINPDEDGYIFLGWTQNGEAPTVAEKYYHIKKGTTGDKDFVVVLEPKDFDISYNLNKGTLPEGSVNPTTYNKNMEKVTLANPIRPFYDFIGWVEDGVEGSVPSTKLTLDFANMNFSKSYSAVWEVQKFDITYDIATGKFAPDAVLPSFYTVPTASEDYLAIIASEPEREHYTFEGWSFDPAVEKLLETSPAPITATALWEPIPYLIRYDLDGGEFLYDAANPDTYNIETETFTLLNPKRDNSNFEGWVISGDNDGNAQQTVTIEKGSFGNKKYYAVFNKGAIPVGLTAERQRNLSVNGKYDIPRPDWVVILPNDEANMHYEKGYAKKEDFYSSLQEAEKQCIYELAEWQGIEVTISYNVTDLGDNLNKRLSSLPFDAFTASRNTNDALAYLDGVLKINSDTKKLNSLNTLIKLRKVVEYWEDVNGGVWVLMSIPLK